MKKIILTVVFISLLTIQYSYAWSGHTHEWICEQIYRTDKELNKKLDYSQFIRGCTAPDVEFKDQQNHHCYVAKQCHAINASKINPNSLAYFSDVEDCIGESYYDCPSMEKFEEYIKKASGSNFSFYIGVSTHYFTDAHVPVHQTMGEDNWKCHIPFEEKIDDNLKKDKKFWTVTQACEIYLPCKKAGKVSRKCEEGYNVAITYSYEDIINLIQKTDKTLSERLKLSYESDYSYLLKKYPTGFFGLIINRIVNFFRMILG